MSAISDTTSLVPGGARSSLYAGHGVRGDAIPSTGTDGPSYLSPCVTLPADAAVEVRGYITRWPTLGTLTPAEDGSFVYIGASDYFDFRLYADGVASTADIGFGAGIVRVYLTVGDPAAVPSAPWPARPTGQFLPIAFTVSMTGEVTLIM